MEASVHRLRINREGGHTHLQAEHFKMWLREAYPEKEAPPPPKSVKWMKLVDLFQFMLYQITIPIDLVWKIFILTPKDNTGTQGIGLLEVLWKVREAVIDTCIKKAVKFHDALHEFCVGKGTGTAIMEPNLSQYLASLDQDPLFLVFLYLKNAYDNLDRGRLLNTL